MEEKIQQLETLLQEIYPNEDFIFGTQILVANSEDKTDNLIAYIIKNKSQITPDHITQYALELEMGITIKDKLERRLRKIFDDDKFVCHVLSHMITDQLTYGLINHIDNHPELTSEEITLLSIEAYRYAIDNDLIYDNT